MASEPQPNWKIATPRPNDPAARPGGLLAKPGALQQYDGLSLGGQVVRRQQPDYSATDNHHLLLLSHHLIQPIKREKRTGRPLIQHSHHCPQHALRDIPGAAPGLLRTPELLRLNSAQGSPAMTEPTTGVATRVKS